MYRKVYDAEGVELVHIQYFHDTQVREDGTIYPTGFQEFRSHMSKLHETYGKYASYVFEGVTSAALSSRKMHQYIINPDTKEPRKWHASATDDLEEFLCMRLPALPYNVGIALHASREKDEVSEMFVRNVSAPGRLSTRHQLAAYYPEVYRAYAKEMVVESLSSEKQLYRLLQTRMGRIEGESWFAASQLNPPQPCWNHYDSLWGEGATPQTLHVMVYGDTGAGKSTFLATLPKPLYVIHFDGLGKEIPYISTGVDGGLKYEEEVEQ